LTNAKKVTILKELGLDKIRIALSGSANISFSILQLFNHYLNIRILEVYGPSEVGGIFSLNTKHHIKFGTKGKPIPGVSLKILEDGELCFRGPNACLGYYNDPIETEQMIQDGWVRSGDLGYLDDNGFLCLTGRTKDIFRLSSGIIITPIVLEEVVAQHPLVTECIVVGEGRPYCAAIISLNHEEVIKLAQLENESSEEYLDSPLFFNAIQKHLDFVNSGLDDDKRILNFRILPRSFDLLNDELTPTMKIIKKGCIEELDSFN